MLVKGRASRQMTSRAIHLWGAIISLLLAANCYFTYRSALEYGKLPYGLRTDEQKSKCLAGEAHGTGEFDCPRGWYLKGSE
jgi:hypothetical protein